MPLTGFLQDCSEIELVAERIYRRLSVAETLPLEMRGLFRQLADDEATHARQLNMAALAFDQTGEGTKAIAHGKVMELLDAAQALLSRVENGVDAKTALQTSARLERDFRRIHLDQATYLEDEEAIATFRRLARSDAEHLATLKEAWERFYPHEPAQIVEE